MRSPVFEALRFVLGKALLPSRQRCATQVIDIPGLGRHRPLQMFRPRMMIGSFVRLRGGAANQKQASHHQVKFPKFYYIYQVTGVLPALA